MNERQASRMDGSRAANKLQLANKLDRGKKKKKKVKGNLGMVNYQGNEVADAV